MTTSVTFELGTILDSLLKAALIAPSKAGTAFDKAAGIMLNINPGIAPVCVVQATNLDAFYIESVPVIEATGAQTRWRLPHTLAKILDSIPKTAGRLVRFEKDPAGGRVKLTSNRMVATVGTIDPDFYPEFDLYEGEFSTTQGVGSRIEQVAWACAKAGNEPLTGVHFTGEHVIATDRYRVCRVPLKMSITNPITVPAGMLASILKKTGEIEVGATSHHIVFRVNDGCHVYSAIYGNEFPAIEKRVTSFEYDGQISVRKNELSSLINLAMSGSDADRMPLIRLIIGRSELAAYVGGDEVGIGDVVDIPGQATHKRISLYFTPGYVLDAVNRTPGDLVTLSYRVEDESKVPIKIHDGSGFEAWVVSRGPANPSASP